MNKIIIVITIAFSARKRRKVFTQVTVRNEFDRLIKEGLVEKGIRVIETRYFDDHPEAVAVTVESPMGIEPQKVFRYIKSVSTYGLKTKYFPKAETLWTRNYWCCRGQPTNEDEKDMLVFIESQRGRN